MNTETVWSRIVALEGETFQQMRGKRFTYSIHGNSLVPSTTNRQLPKSEFEKAIALMPVQNTVPLQKLQGPSYLYAILSDARVRKSDW